MSVKLAAVFFTIIFFFQPRGTKELDLQQTVRAPSFSFSV